MRGWRAKLVFMLIVYFGGYATAIYTLAPAPENNKASASAESSFFQSMKAQAEEKSSVFSVVKSEKFKESLNSGMHKCFEYGVSGRAVSHGLALQRVNPRSVLVVLTHTQAELRRARPAGIR